MFLLDTDALSELEKPHPNAGLVDWIRGVDWLDLHLSVITVAELWKGICSLAAGKRRRELEGMFELLPDRFHNRIIPIDYSIAVTFGQIQSKSGPLPNLDCFIAATAVTRRLTVVTHNSSDMMRTGAQVLDPWTAKSEI